MMNITTVQKDEYTQLLELWESSVRASHDFLSEDDIQFLKPIVFNEAFPNVALRCARHPSGKILGFIGISDDSVDMLFVSPLHFGQGIGHALMRFAENEFGTSRVDVNEQNPSALAFYKKLGYRIVNRSPLDGQGRPFPILHLARPNNNA